MKGLSPIVKWTIIALIAFAIISVLIVAFQLVSWGIM